MMSGLPIGLALATGVNTYLPLFILALYARLNSAHVHLSPPFQFLTTDAAFIVLGLLAASEVLAQKFLGLDNAWDFVHTLFRPLAGAVVAGAATNTDRILEMAVVMLVGGTLATAAHTAKTSLRLASTTGSFGTLNPMLSLGEDAGVVAASLLSIYLPWVMLGVVLLLAVLLAMIGPRAVRTISFEFRVAWAWLGWLGRRLAGKAKARRLQESLLEVPPSDLEVVKRHLSGGEELYGILPGWRRGKGGPHPGWLLITSRRLLHLEPRLLRAASVQTFDYSDVSLARTSRSGLVTRLDLLTRRSDRLTLNLRRSHASLAKLAIEHITNCAPALHDSASHAVTSKNPLAVAAE